MNRGIRRRASLGTLERSMAVSYGLIAAILLLGGLGYLLDWMWNTSPWLMLLGLIVGLAIGFYALGRLIRSRRLRP